MELAPTFTQVKDEINHADRQGALSYWACQPMLLSDGMQGSAKWLDEIYEIESGTLA